MFVKTLDGKLVNLDNAFTVEPIQRRDPATREFDGWRASVIETGPSGGDTETACVTLCWFKGADDAKAYVQRVIDVIGNHISLGDCHLVDLAALHKQHRLEYEPGSHLEPERDPSPEEDLFFLYFAQA